MATIATNSQVHSTTVDYDRLQWLGRELLIAIGENPDRPGIIDTPVRWAKWWQEFIEYDPGKTNTTFEAITTDQMVIIGGMRVWSVCEHHLIPFWCDVTIGYIAAERVLGLSKFARIAHKFAHRPQLQERLVHQIADELESMISPDIAVVAIGEHLCMSMRGIRTPALISSSVMRGAFREDHQTRMEFLSFVKR